MVLTNNSNSMKPSIPIIRKNNQRKFIENMTVAASFGVPLIVILGSIMLASSGDSNKPASRASSNWPLNAHKIKVLGDKLYQSKNYEKALQAYEEAFHLLEEQSDEKLYVHEAAIANNIANTYKRLGNVTVATEWYKRGLEKDGHHFETLYNYANTLLAMKEYTLAEGYFRKVLKLKPNFVPGMMGLSSALRGNHELEESMELLQKAEQLDPKNANLKANLGLQYLAIKDVETSIKYLQKAADMEHIGAKKQLEDLIKATERVREKIVESAGDDEGVDLDQISKEKIKSIDKFMKTT